MKHKDIIILKKICQYCDEAKEACTMFHNSFDQYKENAVFRNSCNMCVLQIGELCKLVSPELREQETEIAWKGWCGIRDIFAHQYSNLDFNAAWDTIQNDLPALSVKAAQMLEKYGIAG